MPPLTVTEAVAQRKSCRAFLSRAPPLSEIRELLALASRAPSGANMQPWRAYVVSGGARDSLVTRVQKLLDAGEAPADSDEFAVYPTREALAQKRDMRDRRRKLGLDMYRLLGITKGDTDGILAALKRNYTFFDTRRSASSSPSTRRATATFSATSAPSSRRFACSRANEVSQPACKRHGANSTSPSPTSSASTASARRSGAASRSATRTRRSRSTGW